MVCDWKALYKVDVFQRDDIYDRIDLGMKLNIPFT